MGVNKQLKLRQKSKKKNIQVHRKTDKIFIVEKFCIPSNVRKGGKDREDAGRF